MTPEVAGRNVAVYAVGTGEILNMLGGGVAFIAQNTPDGCAVIDAPVGLAEDLWRVDVSVDPPALVERPAFGVTLPVELDFGAELALAVPAGTQVSIDGVVAGEADEDGVELEFASPGRVLVELRLFPYAPLRARIQVD